MWQLWDVVKTRARPWGPGLFFRSVSHLWRENHVLHWTTWLEQALNHIWLYMPRHNTLIIWLSGSYQVRFIHNGHGWRVTESSGFSSSSASYKDISIGWTGKVKWNRKGSPSYPKRKNLKSNRLPKHPNLVYQFMTYIYHVHIQGHIHSND